MSTQNWTPESQQALSLDSRELELNIFINAGNMQPMNREKLIQIVNSNKELLLSICQQNIQFWHACCENYQQQQLIGLIKFFTLLEELHEDFNCGDKSPVIAINKLLKQRKTPLSKDILQWIKENSRNRFLPNGRIL